MINNHDRKRKIRKLQQEINTNRMMRTRFIENKPLEESYSKKILKNLNEIFKLEKKAGIIK